MQFWSHIISNLINLMGMKVSLMFLQNEKLLIKVQAIEQFLQTSKILHLVFYMIALKGLKKKLCSKQSKELYK